MVYIGLGSNMGARRKNLNDALSLLTSDYSIKILKKSSIKETSPVDYIDQPDFLNQIILIETDIKPDDLLDILKEIETKMGRSTTIPKGPRIIDLDILLYDDLIIDTDNLKIPHPEITNREFIMDHLIELNPDLVDLI